MIKIKKIAIILTGGTISMKNDAKTGVVPALSANDIIDTMGEHAKGFDLEIVEFLRKPSPAIDTTDIQELAKTIQTLVNRDDIKGIVVTHGTDTLQETAYFLHLSINTQKPIVVTGSMRNISELGYDGPSNLVAAINVANSDDSIGCGTLVVLNDSINCAAEVKKMHTFALDTFKSPEFGHLGNVDHNNVIYYRKTSNNEKKVNYAGLETNVHIFKCSLGCDVHMLEYLAEKNVKGIVIEGFGRGNVPPQVAKLLKKAIDKNIIVVLTSSCPSGSVLGTYAYEGGGGQLQKMGVIMAGNLSSVKARIKLMVLLGSGIKKDELSLYF